MANRVTGAGKYEWPSERATYEGEVIDGCKHGFGRLSFADVPIVYEGQWDNGQRHGEVRVLPFFVTVLGSQGGVCGRRSRVRDDACAWLLTGCTHPVHYPVRRRLMPAAAAAV